MQIKDGMEFMQGLQRLLLFGFPSDAQSLDSVPAVGQASCTPALFLGWSACCLIVMLTSRKKVGDEAGPVGTLPERSCCLCR